MRLFLVGTLLLAAACSGGSSTATPSPSASDSPTASPSATAADPFSSITPPDSPGIGTFDAGFANHAYTDAQGLVSEALFEHDSITGVGTKQLGIDLAGQSKSPSVIAAVANPPVAAGLNIRPRFAASVKVSSGYPIVMRSEWNGESVATPDGDQAMKIDWSGGVQYSVTYAGKPVLVAYAITLSFVYTMSTVEVDGVNLLTAVPGPFHVAPQAPGCSAKGIIVPIGPAPTAVDYTDGPYPAQVTKGVCPG